MPKDYKKRSRGRSAAQPARGWVWMLFGLAIGLSVAAAIYVKDRAPMTGPEPIASQGQGYAEPPPDPEPVEPPRRFDFYDILPKFEVVIPEREPDVRADIEPAEMRSPGAYVLQAGSFGRFADADRMKARLALLGIESRIQKVTIDADTYHRVRVGPINDLARLNEQRRRLRDAQIEILVIRVSD